jgi:hypothetical protein
MASYLMRVMSPNDQLRRLIVLDRDGRMIAADPPLARPRLDYATSGLFTVLSADTPGHVSGAYITDPGGSGMATTKDAAVIGISGLVHEKGVRLGVLLAEVDLQLLGLAMIPLLSAADELYLIDNDGRLLLRATRAFAGDPEAGRDLRGSAAVGAALAGTSRLDADDPLAGGPRLVGTARVTVANWRVIAVRAPTAVAAELDSSLSANRATRIGLVLVLVFASGLYAASVRKLRRRRRDYGAGAIASR